MVKESFLFSSVPAAVQLSLNCATAAHYVKLDLSACYLSFPVADCDRKYFVACVDGKYLQFTTVVFGHTDAPRQVSLALDVVSSALFEAGIAHTRYLDDFFLVAATAKRAWLSAHRAATIIASFGLALSPSKVEGPSTTMEFLGIVFDSVQQTLSISPARLLELRSLLEEVQAKRHLSVLQIQQLVGKLNFAAIVLPSARPFLRRLIDLGKGPPGRRNLRAAVRADLRYWHHHMATWNGREKWIQNETDPFVFGSDASTSGFAYALERAPKFVSAMPEGFEPGALRVGLWSAKNGDAARQSCSSNIQYGEAFCMLAAAVEFGPFLTNSHVVFVIDNEADVYIFNRLRTKDKAVCLLLRGVADQARRYNFSFRVVHRPGDDNDIMDWGSRPSRHRFASVYIPSPPSALPLTPTALANLHAFPPLSRFHSLHHINSRCVQFEPEGILASWWSPCAGW